MKPNWRLLWAAGALAASGLSQAQTMLLEQNFDASVTSATIGDVPPTGWTLGTFHADGSPGDVSVTQGEATWLGWKFLTPATWAALKKADASTRRGDFKRGTGGIALIESDGLRAAKPYSASLTSPLFAVTGLKNYALTFDSHYRQGQAPQTADVTVTFDKGSPFVHTLSADALNQQVVLKFAAPQGAGSARVSWNYRTTSNNWYWALDNVKLHGDDAELPAPFETSSLPTTSEKPRLTVGPTLQNPGPDHMAVMIETSEPSPTVWLRKAGSSEPFTIVKAVNAEGDFRDANIFFGDLKGLASNTLYDYALVTGTSTAPKLAGPFQFKTWPRETDKVTSARFAVVSDTQDGKLNRFRNIVQGLVANDCEGKPAQCAQTLAGFVVPGDLVNSGSSRTHWAAHFFTPLSAISAYVPLLPAMGNHEYFGEQASEGADKGWARTYRKYFNRLPANGSASHPLHWYHVDYLGLRIVGSDFNPASAMHNTGGWTGYDQGRGLFRADYMKEHLDWFTQLMQSTRSEKKPYVLLLNHHPCLSEKWRQGEVIGACDFIAQLEDYGRSTGAITANVNGHVHFYERGNSMNSRHLWLNVASGAGDLEGAKQEDDSDLDVFANTKLSFGYGTLQVGFGGAVPSLEWKRYDLARDGASMSATADDSIRVTSERFAATPKLAQARLGKIDPATLQLGYVIDGSPTIYEAQWQLSKAAKFDDVHPVYDVWGNDTRRENWTYLSGVRVNTQDGADLSVLQLGNMLARPKRVYPNVGANTRRAKVMSAIVAGGDSLLDRYHCAYKWDEFGDVGDLRQGGRQCFARLVQPNGEKGSAWDPFNGKPAQTLGLGNDERWYWRVRVRDEHLNWSDWSEAGLSRLAIPNPRLSRIPNHRC
ncbi:metallophosphoesterase family protein [Diaphorobacter aerolatus]|uniref:Metallophosphoesterase family protein n=1 Tax=Diaphorobacter aerolatus TaxID=1288495 RepID=A0A7H0GHV0_9BURK|nr:metallophosphoesterase [Diaphorobacter aerolatus]QNP47866.1 metallophosphoesterase family protein [Diaphorobacter aerolatus]